MSYTPRLVRPEAGNKYYITKSAGGWSPAIKGSPTDKDCNVLSNCVGYAIGRFNEIGGYGSCKYLPSTNAELFIQKNPGLEISQTPHLGACAVWRKGNTLGSGDGAGHVAIVEQIISPTEIVTSDSGWNVKNPFWTRRRSKGSDGNWGQGAGYHFLGFILNPAVTEEDEKTSYTDGQTVLNIGDVVYISDACSTYANGKTIPAWVKKRDLFVRKIDGDKVTISTVSEGAVTGTVLAKDLVLVQILPDDTADQLSVSQEIEHPEVIPNDDIADEALIEDIVADETVEVSFTDAPADETEDFIKTPKEEFPVLDTASDPEQIPDPLPGSNQKSAKVQNIILRVANIIADFIIKIFGGDKNG